MRTTGQGHCLTFDLLFSDSMTVSNISSKVTGSVIAKFNAGPPWAEGRKGYSNSPGLNTNMAIIPVHGKNL